MRTKWYKPEKPCSICGTTAERRSRDNQCSGCFPEEKEKELQKNARMLGRTFYFPLSSCRTCGQHVKRWVADDKCTYCFPEPAIEEDDFYKPDKPCPKCGLMAFRRVRDDKCFNCMNRNDARKNGKKLYRPTVMCPKCGTLAERRTIDHTCTKCYPPLRPGRKRHTVRAETETMMVAAPDMVISRNDARKLGLEVFRTGTPCLRGHVGFRLVKTMNCIDCLKEG